MAAEEKIVKELEEMQAAGRPVVDVRGQTPRDDGFTKTRTTMKSRQAALHAALAAAQAEMPAVDKDSTNPHFRSRFTSLDHLIALTRPVLNRHGLSISQWPRRGDDGMPELRTRMSHVGGGAIVEDMPLLPGKNDMQGLGAAITYGRRFAWAAACGIASETDDDGESIAQEPTGATETPTPDSRRAPASGNRKTAPTASEKQLRLIDALLDDLEAIGVATRDTAVEYIRSEYGVELVSDLTGGRNGQASQVITRLQFRLAEKLLHTIEDSKGTLDVLLEHGDNALTLGDVPPDNLGAVTAELLKLWKAQVED